MNHIFEFLRGVGSTLEVAPPSAYIIPAQHGPEQDKKRLRSDWQVVSTDLRKVTTRREQQAYVR